MVSILPHLNLDERLRRAGIESSPLVFNQRSFSRFLEEGRLAPEQMLMPECPLCAGTGITGPEGEQEVCSFCGGHGVGLTPFAIEVLKLFDFVDNGKPLISEAELEKENRIFQLKEKIRREKAKISGQVGMHLAGEMQKSEWAAREKVAKEQLKAMRKVEEELSDEIAELATLQAEQEGEGAGS